MKSDLYRVSWGLWTLAIVLGVISVPNHIFAALTPGDPSPIPFSETFENSPSEMASNTGIPLHGQHSWSVSPTNAVSVQTSVKYAGAKAASSSSGVLLHNFNTATATNVWLDFYARVPLRALSENPTPSDGSSLAFYVDVSGNAVATDGSGWSTNTAYTFTGTNWTRLTAHIDYDATNWSLYVAGDQENELATNLFQDLAFRTGAASNYMSILSITGDTGEVSYYLDSLTIARDDIEGKPAHIDTDSDGMSDLWELDRFGTLNTNDFSGDSDGDGFTHMQEFIAGTDPTNGASYMRIVNVDLVSATSSNIAVTWEGGGYSVTSVYAGDTVSRAYSLKASSDSYEASTSVVATVDEGSVTETTNVWIDTAATDNYNSRFYNVMLADYAGLAATNAQDWAMFSQDRADSSKYMICVPVNYGGTNNNLNAKLGDHLARGLHANDTPAEADKLIIKDPVTGVDSEYYLSATGWKSNDVGQGFADVELAPGAAMWVQRLTGAVNRADTVFAGEVWKSGTVSNITVYAKTGSSNGWTMVGWAMANSKTVSGSDTSSNQLGFYAAGAHGGLTGDLMYPDELGDMICIWRNGYWRRMWLIEGAGNAALNGRWWDDLAWTWMNWTFQPGDAFYYYHPTNNYPAEATNFVWTPSP